MSAPTERPLATLLRRVRKELNDPACKDPPESELSIKLTRSEWKDVRDDLVKATTWSGER